MRRPSIRTCLFVVLTTTALRSLAQDVKSASEESAKQLFQKMEHRLTKIKTLECRLEIKGSTETDAPFPFKDRGLEGSLALAEANQVRLELRKSAADASDLPAGPVQLLISDGHRVLRQHSQMSAPKIDVNVPVSLGADLLTSLARTGIFVTLLPLPPVAAKDAQERFSVSGFELGSKEKLDGRVAQRVDYQLHVKGQDAPIPFSLWVDLESTLPLKRVLPWKIKAGHEFDLLTERYKNIEVDVKVDDGKFELPEK
jgi:hypothetical protein